MDSIYNIIIELWKNLKLICYSHPVAASAIGGIFIVPLFITICGGTIANRNEGNRNRRKDLNEQLEYANKQFKLKQYNLALEEYLKVESRIKSKRKLIDILYNEGICYYKMAQKSTNSEESYGKSIYYFSRVTNLNKKDYVAYDSAANSYYQLSLIREKEENLKKAIELYEKAIKIYKKKNKKTYKNESDFIILENGLASCFENLAEVENKCYNLNYALKIYKSIPYKDESLSCDIVWRILNNIGRIYEKKAKINSRSENLKKALSYYSDALERRDIEKYPEDYGLINNNIGNIFLNLSEMEEEEENLKQALEFYNLALEVYDPQNNKRNYAMEKNNIGSVYRKLFNFTDDKEYLVESINNHKESLKFRSIKETPIDFAYTVSNLGLAYSDRGEVDKNIKDIDLAIECYNKALKIFKPDKYLENFISIKTNLGIVYKLRGILLEKKEDLQKSIRIYNELLNMYSINRESYIYDAILENLIITYRSLGDLLELNERVTYYNEALNNITELKYQSIIKIYLADAKYRIYLQSDYDDEKDLDYAMKLYEESLNYFDLENEIYYYAYNNKQLGRIYMEKGMVEKGKKCFENALEIFTQDSYPNEYEDIGSVLEFFKESINE